jgi:hypothetical protein
MSFLDESALNYLLVFITNATCLHLIYISLINKGLFTVVCNMRDYFKRNSFTILIINNWHKKGLYE